MSNVAYQDATDPKLIQRSEQCRSRLGRVLGLEEPASGQVLFSLLKNETYAHNLLVCRKTPEFLSRLLSHPPCQIPADLGEKSLLEQAEKLLREWEESTAYQDAREDYEERYGIYLEELKKLDPSEAPCRPCAEIRAEDFREVYLDHNATTYIRPEVGKLLRAYYAGEYDYGNPSSNTVQGSFAAGLVLVARQKIAHCLQAEPEEIIFTASGTEANNLAIKGIAFQHLEEKGHLLTSQAEHPSVLRTMEYLETLGFAVTYLEVDKEGFVSPVSVQKALRKNTILVSIIGANNEIGTINPLQEIGEICGAAKVPLMVDGIQAFGKIPLNPRAMGISLLSFSGHKIYAPKGSGGLYVQKGIALVPQLHGGGQEDGLRSGTENVASIMALGEAAALAHAEMDAETKRLLGLRSFFLENLRRAEPDLIINGSLEQRLPNNLNLGFKGVEGGALLRSLNKIGISVSLGSACSSRQIKTSHVLAAIGADTGDYAALRFSFGLKTQEEDLAYSLKYLVRILQILRRK